MLYSMSSARSTQVYVIAFVGSGIQKCLPAIITPLRPAMRKSPHDELLY